MDGTRYLFGVSGLLYRRNVLMYDRQTESLWSQMAAKAVTGPMAGASLEILPAEHTSWEDWKTRHPDTQVLSFNTGYSRNYSRDPYRNLPLDRREAAAVFSAGQVKLYPLRELEKAEKDGQEVVEELAGNKLTIRYDRKLHRLSITSVAGEGGGTGEPVRQFIAFLADLRAFYPDAEIFQYKRKR